MDQENSLVVLYVPCPTEEVALDLAKQAVEQDMAFCSQVFPKIKSLYKWQGRLNLDDESILLLKTFPTLVDSLTRLLLAKHPYEVPCILKLPTESLNPAYTSWALASK
jgi:periplasmic divalent cation tolerance protein